MKTLLIVLIFLVTFPAAVGSATATIATAPHPAPAAPLFAWVPAGGFADHFPFGQCTWWAAYNRRVTWTGNAGDWLDNAQAQGVVTSREPSFGAIVVYRRGGRYSALYGHVAVVIAVGSGTYTVSEMNAVGWGQVSTRRIAWPDWQVDGFIPLQWNRQ